MLKTSSAKPAPGGSIIGTASVAGLRSGAGPTEYSASKAAVVSIMQTVSYQLAGKNIRCNAICPGVVETGMTKYMYDAARARGTEKKIGQLNPLKRGAVADEVARVVLFLASDEASYVNGQVGPRFAGYVEQIRANGDRLGRSMEDFRQVIHMCLERWHDCLNSCPANRGLYIVALQIRKDASLGLFPSANALFSMKNSLSVLVLESLPYAHRYLGPHTRPCLK